MKSKTIIGPLYSVDTINPVLLFRSTLLVLLFSLTLLSCKSTFQTEDVLASSIPAEAVFVASINPERIMEKSDYGEIKEYGMFKELLSGLEDSIPVFAEIFDSPHKSGIDFSQNAYFYALNNPTRKRQFIVALLLPLSDAAAFESMISASSKSGIQQGEVYRYVFPLKGESVITWDDDRAMVFGFSKGKRDMNAISNLVAVDESISLATNKAFAKGFRGEHDLRFFINSNPIVENLPPSALLGPSFAGISKDVLKDNYLFGSWDFETGQAKGMMRYVIKPELSKHYSVMFKDQLKTDFTGLIPTEHLRYSCSQAYDLKGLNQVLVEKGVINMANAYLEPVDMEFKDVAKAIQGDVSYSNYEDGEGNNRKHLLIIPVLDNKVVNTLLDYYEEANLLQRINDDTFKGNQEDNPLFGWMPFDNRTGNYFCSARAIFYT